MRTLRGLARLFRPSLTADWEFTDGWHDDGILLICNIDDATTRDLWLQGALGDLPLALATSAPEIPNGWVLRKPLRGQGEHGLVHVLNEAAATHRAGGAAPTASFAPEPPPGPEPEAPRATVVPFRAAVGSQGAAAFAPAYPTSGSLAGQPAPLPIVAKAPHAEPGDQTIPAPQTGMAEFLPAVTEHGAVEAEPEEETSSAVLVDTEVEPPPAADPEADEPATAEEDEPAAADEPDVEAKAPEPAAPAAPLAIAPPEPQSVEDQARASATAALAAALDPTSIIFQAPDDTAGSDGMRVNVAPVSDLPSQYGSRAVQAPAETQARDEESALRNRLRALQEQPAETDEPQDDFLALLNRLHWLRSVGVVMFDGIAPFCVVPVEGFYYGRITLDEIDERLRTSRRPAQVRVMPTLGEALRLVGAEHIPPGHLKDLFWVANMRCANAEQVTRFEKGAFRLRRWPDLTHLPHERQHIAWCGILARRPVTLAALGTLTHADQAEAAAFLASCAAQSLLEVVEVTAEAESSAPVAQTAKSRERSSIFRSLLNRLGFGRS